MLNQLSSDQWLPELKDGDRLSDLCTPGAANTPQAWAHADCDAKHKGCHGIGFSMLEKLGAGDKMARANEEREARLDLLAEESSSYCEKKDKEESEQKGAWRFDKDGKKTFGPRPANSPKPFYTPDGYVVIV